MRFIVITPEVFLAGESDAVNLLFENGLETLHLRKPGASLDETKNFIMCIDKVYHQKIVLHDNYRLVEEFHLKGIHLNRRNEDITAYVSAMREKHYSISRSCHSFDDVVASRDCDYVFLSPIFDSVSKAGYNQGFTSEQLDDARCSGIINQKVMALGGMTPENIPLVRQYGFGGVVVLGALWSNFTGNGEADELLRRFNELARMSRKP